MLDSIVYSEVEKLETFFKFNVDFFYILENGGGNALFTKHCESPGCVGSIMLGVNLLEEHFQKYGIDAIHIFRAVLAHEFGHGVQDLIMWDEGWKRPELHADYLAGYYIGANYDYTEELMEKFYAEFYSRGKYNYFDKNHHGTPMERKCAFLEGYYFAKEYYATVESANVYGLQYVAANDPCMVRKYKRRVEKNAEDVKNNNIGKLVVVAADKKKYRILTNNQVGTGLNFYLNQSKVKVYANGFLYNQVVPKTNIVYIDQISPTNSHPVYIYRKHWFWGERLMLAYNVQVQRGKTTTVKVTKNRVTFSVD